MCALAWRTVLLCVAGLMVASSAGAGDAPRRRDCEAQGGRPSLAGCVHAAQHVSLQPPAQSHRKPDPAPQGPSKPGISGDQFRPPSPALANRSKALLIDEIRRLEALLAKTRRKAPDRALLVRRIADDYSELAVIAEHEQITAEIRAESASKQAPLVKTEQKAQAPRR